MMLFYSIAAFSIFFGFSYLLLMLRYSRDWNQLKEFLPREKDYKTKVSVIVVARNEADNITACLKSILSQNYPIPFFDIVLADDDSNDKTVEIAESLGIKNLKIIQNRALKGKKQLLSFAVSNAWGDLIICTDADCQVPQSWITAFVSAYEEQHAKFIAAPVLFNESKTFFKKFQALDFAGMMSITGAGIQGRYLYMCNGANLAYPKSVFVELGGFEGIDSKASGDDMLLMQKIANKYPDKIVYLKNPNSAVLTEAAHSLAAFWQQRLRWASKSGDYPQKSATLQLGLVWLFMFFILINLVAGFFNPNFFIVLLILFVLKMISDYILLSSATTYFSQERLMKTFLPSVFLHWIYILTVGFVSMFKIKYNWKGRKWS
jgi:cellulose synthase/poly-beta-1,6-N-acetylglucosamine synthase-like glycosyltransferase